MYIQACRGNFSIGELGHIDEGIKFTQAELQAEFDGLLYRCKHTTGGLGIPPVLLASLTSKQIEARKFLLANDFTLIGEQKINPNTTNLVQTFIRKQEPYTPEKIDISYKNWRMSCSKDDLTWSKRIYLVGTAISCSTYFLSNSELLSNQSDVELAMFSYYKPTCAIIITTIPIAKADAIKTIESVNFVKVDEFKSHYPTNSMEPYGLFIRYVTKEDRKKYRCETTYDLQGQTE